MIYMTKYLLILFTLTACTSRDYLEMPSTIYQSIKGADLEISKSFYDSKEFSFIKISIGRNIVATMTLLNVDKDVYEWVGQNSAQRIFTKHGKIIKTTGLERNTKVLDYSNFSLRGDLKSGQHLIHLLDPVGIFAQNFQIIKINAAEYQQTWLHYMKNGFQRFKFYSKPEYVIEEKFNTEVYRWNGTNIYWLDKNLNVTKSVQTIHPYLPKISIDYFYKY